MGVRRRSDPLTLRGGRCGSALLCFSYLDRVKLPASAEEVAPGDEVILRIGHRALAEISVKDIYESMCKVRETHLLLLLLLLLLSTC